MKTAPVIESRSAAEAAYLVAFGRRVRRLRLLGELTQDQLAVAAGMSRSFVSLLEHGDASIGLFRLLRLAQALGVKVPALLPDVALPECAPAPSSDGRPRTRGPLVRPYPPSATEQNGATG